MAFPLLTQRTAVMTVYYLIHRSDGSGTEYATPIHLLRQYGRYKP